MDDKLFMQVDEYISNLLAPVDDVLGHAERATHAAGMPMINISPVQGKFLQVLAKMCNAKKILELGTLGGYSTIWLARAIPDDGEVITIEADAGYAEVAHKNFEFAELQHKIDIRIGKALDVLPEIEKERLAPFDLIFIDADKPPYPEYFQWAIKLARPGSIIIADNVIREGAVLDENSTDERVQGVRRLNQWLSGNKAVTATILQNVGIKEYDGMVVAVVN
jgi:caffeoyl-CoA O-methyltransferase